MKKEEALLIPELCIDVTPAVEDAFYAFREIESTELDQRLAELPDDYVGGDEVADRLMKEFEKNIAHADAARERLRKLPVKEQREAMLTAFQMIENIEKYGVPCAQWCDE